jgi:rhamnosyltransferase
VAVLLATYNGAAYCEAQLASILWQCRVDVHVYVRDDGSTDSTLEIILAWVARHPGRITLIDSGGISTGSANGNFFALLAAVDTTSYDYLAFADQDDVWMPDKLARAIDRLKQEGADGYSSDLIVYDVPGNAAWVLHKAGEAADLDYLFQGGSAGCTYVLTRRAAEIAAGVMAQAPAFCPDASHDWILYAICRSRKMKWARDPAAEILYRQHGRNQYGARQGWGELVVKLRLVRSRWYRNHILWLRHVVVGCEDERQVLDAVARGSLVDRWRLIRQAARFRRGRGETMRLRAAIALRMI